jgi:hypothetical protein
MLKIELEQYNKKDVLTFISSLFPNWPEYIISEWLFRKYHDKPATLQFFIEDNPEFKKIKWERIVKWITRDSFDKWTRDKLNPPHIEEEFSFENIKESSKILAEINFSNIPIIVLNNGGNYRMLSGWNQTVNNFRIFPDGFETIIYEGRF